MIFVVALVFGHSPAFAQDSFDQQEVPFAPFSVVLSFPEFFGGGTFVKELPSAEAVSVATAVTDTNGTLFYVISQRDTTLAATDVSEWADLETVTYRYFIYAVTPSAGLLQFCRGTLPLKSYISGLTFDPSNSGRLMVFIRTLAVNEETCGFLILGEDSTASATKLKTPLVVPAADSSNTGSWDLSGLEQCFFEKLSIIQISGHFEILPYLEASPLND